MLMKTFGIEFVLFGWLAYNIAIEIVSWFEREDELQASYRKCPVSQH